MGWKYFFAIILIFTIGCSQKIEEQKTIKDIQEVVSMKLTSPAFKNNGMIPSEYTCDGDDVSPELIIESAPRNAKSLALIADDPDAPVGTWVHWVVWNIPVNTKTIPKGGTAGIEGITDFRKSGYGGPCPPSGTHRYFFKLYALDTELNLPKSATKKELEKAMQGHVIEKAELIGKYSR